MAPKWLASLVVELTVEVDANNEEEASAFIMTHQQYVVTVAEVLQTSIVEMECLTATVLEGV